MMNLLSLGIILILYKILRNVMSASLELHTFLSVRASRVGFILRTIFPLTTPRNMAFSTWDTSIIWILNWILFIRSRGSYQRSLGAIKSLRFTWPFGIKNRQVPENSPFLFVQWPFCIIIASTLCGTFPHRFKHSKNVSIHIYQTINEIFLSGL